MIVVDLEHLFTEPAKLQDLDRYVRDAMLIAGEGNDVTLTGRAPIWLYLAVAHALHGKVKKLVYRSPTTGDVLIFDHDPF